MDPQAILRSKEILSRIETACQRQFADENDTLECYSYVLDQLKANDYRRLRGFAGKSSFKTYLYTLINALIIDFRRKRYGRRRVPKAVTRLGEWAVAVYRYICWQKYSLADSYEFLLVEGLFTGTYPEFENQSEPVMQAPCRQNAQFVSGNPGDTDHLNNATSSDTNPLEDLVAKLDAQRKFQAAQAIRKVVAELTEPEQLMVKLVYSSNHSAARASRVVGLKPATGRKRLKKILLRIKEKLLTEGIRKP